jgi:hypothetical protein
VSRRLRRFVEPVPAATHLNHAGTGARYAADEDILDVIENNSYSAALDVH